MTTKITTESGFICEIDEELKDDAEFFDLLCDTDEDPRNSKKVIEYILGEEGKKALYDHVRGENGRVKMSDVTHEIRDIIKGLNSKKK